MFSCLYLGSEVVGREGVLLMGSAVEEGAFPWHYDNNDHADSTPQGRFQTCFPKIARMPTLLLSRHEYLNNSTTESPSSTKWKTKHNFAVTKTLPLKTDFVSSSDKVLATLFFLKRKEKQVSVATINLHQQANARFPCYIRISSEAEKRKCSHTSL